MPGLLHVKAFRLFDLAYSKISGKNFQIKDWEKEHLQQCEECQALFAVFVRQFRERPSFISSNGEINSQTGLYRNVCCGLELFISAGKVFPDCQRHKNLPTIWKRIDETIARPDDPDKKRSA